MKRKPMNRQSRLAIAMIGGLLALVFVALAQQVTVKEYIRLGGRVIAIETSTGTQGEGDDFAVTLQHHNIALGGGSSIGNVTAASTRSWNVVLANPLDGSWLKVIQPPTTGSCAGASNTSLGVSQANGEKEVCFVANQAPQGTSSRTAEVRFESAGKPTVTVIVRQQPAPTCPTITTRNFLFDGFGEPLPLFNTSCPPGSHCEPIQTQNVPWRASVVAATSTERRWLNLLDPNGNGSPLEVVSGPGGASPRLIMKVSQNASANPRSRAIYLDGGVNAACPAVRIQVDQRAGVASPFTLVTPGEIFPNETIEVVAGGGNDQTIPISEWGISPVNGLPLAGISVSVVNGYTAAVTTASSVPVGTVFEVWATKGASRNTARIAVVPGTLRLTNVTVSQPDASNRPLDVNAVFDIARALPEASSPSSTNVRWSMTDADPFAVSPGYEWCSVNVAVNPVSAEATIFASSSLAAAGTSPMRLFGVPNVLPGTPEMNISNSSFCTLRTTDPFAEVRCTPSQNSQTPATPSNCRFQLPFTISSTVSGTKDIWIEASGPNGTLVNRKIGTFTVLRQNNQQPTYISVLPSAGTTIQENVETPVTATFREPDGPTDLQRMDLHFVYDATRSCSLRYVRAGGRFLTRQGDTYVDVGTNGPVSAGCSFTDLSYSISGLDHTLSAKVRFNGTLSNPPLTANYKASLTDNQGAIAESQATVNLPASRPRLPVLTGRPSPGTSGTVVVSYADPNGPNDLKDMYFQVGNSPGDGSFGCFVRYRPSDGANQFTVKSSLAELTGAATGGALPQSIERCTLKANSTTATTTATERILTLDFDWKNDRWTGAKYLKAHAIDLANQVGEQADLGMIFILPPDDSSPLPLLSTGASEGRLLNPGETETAWPLLSPLSAKVIEMVSALRPWWLLDHGPLSRWIGPRADAINNSPAGTYTYQKTFALNALPTSMAISGVIVSDNTTTIKVNGTAKAFSHTSTPYEFSDWSQFQVSDGLAQRDSNSPNSVSFEVLNGGSLDNPTGFQMRLDAAWVRGVKPNAGTGTPMSTVGIGGLHNTGKAGSELSFSGDDSYWKVFLPQTNTAVQARILAPEKTPIGLWLDPGGRSRWIGPSDDQTGLGALPQSGSYRYQTTFILPENVTSGKLALWIAADNGCTGIKLNNTVLTPPVGGCTFNRFTGDYAIESGFQGGVNTLEITVDNSAPGPTGLRVEMAGSYTTGGTATYTLTANPGTRAVAPGGVAEYPIAMTSPNGFSGSVGLSVVGALPAGVTASWTPSSSLSAGGSATLRLTTSAATPVGSHTIAVQSDPAHVVTLTLVVATGGGTTVPIDIYNTGKPPTGLMPSGDDPKWWVVHPGSTTEVAAKVVSGSAQPGWLLDTSGNSQWIAPGPNQAVGGGSAPGEYKYRTRFNLTSTAGAQLTLRMASDDGCPTIQLNTATAIAGPNCSYMTWSSTVTINSGFVVGPNTLEFTVTNGGTSTNPTGLRVEISGTVAGAAPPPPLVFKGTGVDAALGADDLRFKVKPGVTPASYPPAASACAAYFDGTAAAKVMSAIPQGYVLNGTSKWISSVASGIPVPAGSYIFRQTLDLTGYQHGTASVVVNLAGDDDVKVYVNCVYSGITIPGDQSPWAALSGNRTLPAGIFSPGVNAIDFVAGSAAGSNYTGMRVEVVSVAATPQ